MLEEDWTDIRKSEQEHKNANVQKIIITSVDRKPQMHLLNCTTSKEMTNKVTEIYRKDTEHKKYSFFFRILQLYIRKRSNIKSHIICD